MWLIGTLHVDNFLQVKKHNSNYLHLLDTIGILNRGETFHIHWHIGANEYNIVNAKNDDVEFKPPLFSLA